MTIAQSTRRCPKCDADVGRSRSVVRTVGRVCMPGRYDTHGHFDPDNAVPEWLPKDIEIRDECRACGTDLSPAVGTA